jgi:hypothetical protein
MPMQKSVEGMIIKIFYQKGENFILINKTIDALIKEIDYKKK